MPWRSGLRYLALVPRRSPKPIYHKLHFSSSGCGTSSSHSFSTQKSSIPCPLQQNSWTSRSVQCLESWESTIAAERRAAAAHLTHQWLALPPAKWNDHQDNCRLVTLLLQKMAQEEDNSSNKGSSGLHSAILVLLQQTLAVLAEDVPSLAIRLFGTFRDHYQGALPPSAHSVLLAGLSRTAQVVDVSDHHSIQSWTFADLFEDSTSGDETLLLARNRYLQYLVAMDRVSKDDGVSDKTEVLDTISSLIDHMRPSAIDANSYSALLRACVQANQVDRACATLRTEIVARSSTVCCNLCLAALADRGEDTQADQLFREIFVLKGTQSPSPDSYSYLAVIRAWQHSPHRATEWLDHMHHVSNLPPNLYCCNAVLESWARLPNQGENVAALLDSLVKNYGFEPSTTTLTNVIKAWGNSTQQSIDAADRATEAFGLIVDPDGPAYTALLKAWGNSVSHREDAIDKVLRVWEEMLTRATKPTLVAYNILLRALAQSRQSSDAESCLHNAARFSVIPNTTSYSLVMSSFRGQVDADAAIHRLWETLLQQYNTIRAETLRPTPSVVSAALRYHSCSETADLFFWKLVANESHHSTMISVDVCNVLLRRWSQSRNPVAVKRSEDVLQFMLQQGLAPTWETYNYMVHTWKISGRQFSGSRLKELQTLQSTLR